MPPRCCLFQIAGFIFGKNVAADGASSKVAMTSPVTLEMGGDSQKIAMTSPVTAEMGPGARPGRAPRALGVRVAACWLSWRACG